GARRHYAGSKGIGRFSSDRLGAALILQTRTKPERLIHRLSVNWELFERSDKDRFEQIPVEYAEVPTFSVPPELQEFSETLEHGTIIEIRELRRRWSRSAILSLKASLAKLINPFGAATDSFNIV